MATSQSVAFTASGNWTCPANISAVWATICGGGGGGAAKSGGAGSGELATAILMAVTPNTVYPVVVGAGGVGAAFAVQPTHGTQSSFNGYIALGSGAYPAVPYGQDKAAAGGGVGGAIAFSGGAGTYSDGLRESPNYTGGSGGGPGSFYGAASILFNSYNFGSGSSGGNPNFPVSPYGPGTYGSGPGAGTLWGGNEGLAFGGAITNANPSHYGSGAPGGSEPLDHGNNSTGGNGAPGYVLLMWSA